MINFFHHFDKNVFVKIVFYTFKEISAENGTLFESEYYPIEKIKNIYNQKILFDVTNQTVHIESDKFCNYVEFPRFKDADELYKYLINYFGTILYFEIVN